jgi:transposase
MSRLPTVHVPAKVSRDRKSMCGMREALVQTRTRLISLTRGWMRPQGLGVIRSGSPTTFHLRVREHVASRGGTIPPYVEPVLRTIQALSLEILAADEELEAAAASDPTCQLLMTAPGVGPTTAVRFAAAIDDVGRFADAHKVQSYLGLTPGEKSSGQKQKRTGVTKAGSSKLRWVLVQAAWVARRYYKDHPVVAWSYEVESRRGKAIAVMALVRKLAGILYAMWRDGVPYEKNHRVAAAKV